MKGEEKLLARRLGQNVRRERLSKGYSQERLAGLCSLHRSAINNIEKGQRLPHLLTVLKIISVLEITSEELLRGTPSGVAGVDGEWLLPSQRVTDVPA
jgi:transcriptional regulator with XRE-family HTH domain